MADVPKSEAPVLDLASAQKTLDQMVGPAAGPDSFLVEAGASRKVAIAIEDHDPIYYDAERAKERGLRGVAAPWSIAWLAAQNCSPVALNFSFGRATVHGQDEFEFGEPIIVGDVLTVEAAIVEATAKQGKTGLLGQVVIERRFTNQRGELCVVLRTTAFRR